MEPKARRRRSDVNAILGALLATCVLAPSCFDEQKSAPSSNTSRAPAVSATSDNSGAKTGPEAKPRQPAPSNWKAQANPEWPKGCLIEDLGLHPFRPWLALACHGSRYDDGGALIVLDFERRALHSVHVSNEGPFGWNEWDDNLLRWHASGEQLAVNRNTNGIALMDGDGMVGEVYPNDGRDSGVHFVWVDDELFADSGHLIRIRRGDYLTRGFVDIGAPRLAGDIEWNAKLGAVVGTLDVDGYATGIVAFNPHTRKVLYQKPLADTGRITISRDGQYFTAYRKSPPEAVNLHRADTGEVLRTIAGAQVVVGAGSHMLVAGEHEGELIATVLEDGAVRTTLRLGARKLSREFFGTAAGASWSPSGDRVALLFDGEQVEIYALPTGKRLAAFATPHPPLPQGLPEYAYPGRLGIKDALQWLDDTRIAHVAGHHVTVWSTSGMKLHSFVTP